jgi:biofilm PGA synthesis lipoprotein PgaB
MISGKLFAAENLAENHFLVLCYHDIPKDTNNDYYAIDQKNFIKQLEYLTNHGYTFISLDDVRKANKKEKNLPEKSVLLTFDDGYVSFYEFVYPV